MEAVGVVSRVGEAVDGYRVGDSYIASLPGCFSSHVTVPVDSLFAVRQSVIPSPSDAATIPVVYMTAYYALHQLARLSAGERVLIHAAAGGVGLAAIQVARWLGAEIFATAGSPEKRDFLRRQGVEHVWDSRTLEFADGIRAVTNGRGVDVALNSLPGEHVLKTLAVMAPFGRFVEIGKRDIVQNSRLPMLPFNRNLTFAAVDLDQMMVDKPDLVRRILGAVWERVEAGDFSPLPVRVFPAAEVAEAFRYMAQAKQIGKVVVDMEDSEGVSLLPSQEKEKRVKGDATYLITGGFGGFGLEVGKWLAKAGARHLVLVGRSGPATQRARQAVGELTHMGVSVKSVTADVSEESQVADLLADIRETMPPLRGIFHTAAVLDDGLLMNLDETRVARVMTPKARGAWILHQQTRSIPLDLFVLFSSATTWMGNPGQGNYVAANAFLDGLAQHRRAEGLAATSISWGALADVGMLATNAQAAEHLSRMGIRAFPAASAAEALSHILAWDPTMLGVMDIDWDKWRQAQPAAARSPRLARLRGGSEDAGQSLASTDLRTVLMAMPPEDRLDKLASAMANVVGEALRMPAEKVNVHQALSDMGIDSLVGVELQLTISTTVGVEVSLLELMNAGSILDLGRRLLERMDIPTLGQTSEAMSALSVTGAFVSQQAY
jgi:NADPH:quinone reductase-like Zn-dependent oxidoreductase